MHLSISTKFTYKNLPKGHRGLRSSNITFGAKQPIGLAKMSFAVLSEIFDWYLVLGDAKKLNSEIEVLRQWLATVEFSDQPEPPNNGLHATEQASLFAQD